MITKLIYNWYPVNDGNQQTVSYQTHMVGKNGVTRIEEHPAAGEGDKWFYWIHFEDDHYEMVFNPNTVISVP